MPGPEAGRVPIYDGSRDGTVQRARMAEERDSGADAEAVRKRIREAGERARAEAEARRAGAATATAPAKEAGGREGPDPARYGDWENKGIASDF